MRRWRATCWRQSARADVMKKIRVMRARRPCANQLRIRGKETGLTDGEHARNVAIERPAAELHLERPDVRERTRLVLGVLDVPVVVVAQAASARSWVSPLNAGNGAASPRSRTPRQARPERERWLRRAARARDAERLFQWDVKATRGDACNPGTLRHLHLRYDASHAIFSRTPLAGPVVSPG